MLKIEEEKERERDWGGGEYLEKGGRWGNAKNLYRYTIP